MSFLVYPGRSDRTSSVVGELITKRDKYRKRLTKLTIGLLKERLKNVEQYGNDWSGKPVLTAHIILSPNLLTELTERHVVVANRQSPSPSSHGGRSRDTHSRRQFLFHPYLVAGEIISDRIQLQLTLNERTSPTPCTIWPLSQNMRRFCERRLMLSSMRKAGRRPRSIG